MARNYTITQSGESRSYSIDDGVGAPGSDASVTTANVRAAVPNMVEVASPANNDFIQRVSGSWVTRTIAQVRTALGLGSAAYTDSTDYATAAQGTTADGALQRSGGTMTGAINMGAQNISNAATITANDNIVTPLTQSNAIVNEAGTGAPSFPQGIKNPISDTVSTLPIVAGALVETSDSRLSDDRSPTAAGLAAKITAATSKATPVDADEIPLADSAASFGLKKLTWANLKATAKTYFDGLYVTLTGNQTVAGAKTFTSNTAMDNLVVTGTAGTGAGGFFDLFSNRARFFGYDYATGIYKDVVINDALYVQGGANIRIANPSPSEKLDVTGNAKVSGNIELGHASDTTLSRSAAGKLAVEGVDVVLCSGTQTIAGAKTMSGQLELTGQAATNSTSAMTRELVKTSPFEIPDTIQLGTLYTETAGTASLSATGSLNGCSLNSGTTTSSRAHAVFLSEPHYWENSGAGINYDVKMEFAGNFRYDYNGNNAAEAVARFLVGAPGGATFADQDAFNSKGVGFEIASRGATSNEAKIRLVYHDGTTYKTSAWSNFGNTDANFMYSFYFVNEGNGTITLTVGRTGAGEGIGARSAGIVTISANDAPTGQGGNTRHNVIWTCVNSTAAYTSNLRILASPVFYRQGL